MATITHRGAEVHTTGELPAVNSIAPDFTLTGTDLKDIHLGDFRGKRVILNIFPSIDTGTCAASVRKFNQEAASLSNTVVLCVSRDLPFAQKRFCAAEGIENVLTASEFRDDNFSSVYKVKLTDGVLRGLFSRCVIVVDEEGRVAYTEQVPDISHEPDYEAALAVIA